MPWKEKWPGWNIFPDTFVGCNQQSKQPNSDKIFYKNWCNFFSLDVEGEDPREYDPTTGQVLGIRNVATPDWAARKPGHVPNLFKNMKGTQLKYLEDQN